MYKMLVVAGREYKAAVKTKSFIITMLIMPIFMGGSILAQLLLKGISKKKEQTYAIIDRTEGGTLYKALKQASDARNAKMEKTPRETGPPFKLVEVKPEEDRQAQRLALSEQVRSGELMGILEIGPKVFDPDAGKGDQDSVIRYQTNRPTSREFLQFAQPTLARVIRAHRAEGKAVSIGEIESIIKPVEMEQAGLSRLRDGEYAEDSEWSRYVSMGVPIVLVMLMFMVIMIGATPMMQGVLEEKMNRIAEVLLGSVSPFELMMGKLIGMAGVSITIVSVYLAGGYCAALYFEATDYVPVGVLWWFLVYQIIAALMYGSLFAAVGAACSELKETQNLMWPVLLLVCFPMFVLGNVLDDPTGPVATGMSFFPFATPMLMVMRMSIPPGIPMWQPLAGVVISLLTTVLCVYVAGRIFRVGLLIQGKGPKLSELVKWVFRS